MIVSDPDPTCQVFKDPVPTFQVISDPILESESSDPDGSGSATLETYLTKLSILLCSGPASGKLSPSGGEEAAVVRRAHSFGSDDK